MRFTEKKPLLIFFLLTTFSSLTPAAEKRPFKLKDFQGEWVFSTASVGGVGSNAGPGIASAAISHVTLDAEGRGMDDNSSSIAYMADGQLSGHSDERGGSLTLTLDDPIVGAGKITYADFGPSKEKKTFEFMATRAKNGAVNKLFLQLVDSGGVSIVFNGIAERQQEK